MPTSEQLTTPYQSETECCRCQNRKLGTRRDNTANHMTHGGVETASQRHRLELSWFFPLLSADLAVVASTACSQTMACQIRTSFVCLHLIHPVPVASSFSFTADFVSLYSLFCSLICKTNPPGQSGGWKSGVGLGVSGTLPPLVHLSFGRLPEPGPMAAELGWGFSSSASLNWGAAG